MKKVFYKIYTFVRKFIFLYSDKRIAQASAAMSYFLIMTVFPVIICLYSMLGNNYVLALRVLDFLENFLTEGTMEYLRNFVRYVAWFHSPAMMLAGLTLIVTTASSAVSTLQTTIGDMQGGRRHDGLKHLIETVVFSLVFVAAIYFGIMAMVTGSAVLDFIDEHLPFIHVKPSWVWLRFVLFFGLELAMLWAVYAFSRRRGEKYAVLPGAILAAVALAAVSFFFSLFLSASARYPLIYGSLASVILLMFWLFACSVAIFCGAAFNIVIRDMKKD